MWICCQHQLLLYISSAKWKISALKKRNQCQASIPRFSKYAIIAYLWANEDMEKPDLKPIIQNENLYLFVCFAILHWCMICVYVCLFFFCVWFSVPYNPWSMCIFVWKWFQFIFPLNIKIYSKLFILSSHKMHFIPCLILLVEQ